jgi:hypothetical protein
MDAGKDLTPAEVEQLLDGDDPMEAGGGGNPPKAPSLLSTGCNTDPASNTVSTGTCTDPSTPSCIRHHSLSSSASSTGTITSTGTGSLPRAYANVRAARSDINTVRPLCGSEVYIKNDLGSFVNEGDERYALANHRHCYNVEEVKSNLSAVLSEDYEGETVIVYQLFDNSFYKSCNAEGVRTLPVKLLDNKYHVQGRLVMADRDEFRGLFTEVLPLLRAGLQHTKILLTPLVRYLLQPCCRDPTHLTNRCKPTYGTMIAEAMCEARAWLKGLAFTRRIKNFSVICPNEMLGHEDRHFWQEDPVHMVESGYKELGKRLLEAMLNAEVSRKMDSAGPSVASGTDWAVLRAPWVKENDSQVHRNYKEIRGRGNTVGLKWRPPRGFRGGNRGGGRPYRGRKNPY